MTIPCVVAVSIANIHREPDPASELVTQALMNVPAHADTPVGEWTHVTLPDYEGWIDTAQLADPIVRGFTKVGEHCATPLDLVVVVTSTHTTLYTAPDSSETTGTIYLSTTLPLLDTTQPTRLQVALPTANTAWVDRAAVSIRHGSEPYPRMPISAVILYARAFIDRRYLWGGTSWAGIDCSALVQLCYRMGGYIIPRDADQQYYTLTHSIAREEMQEGDLIFFGRNAITHVGLALSNKEYLHAEGQRYNRVLISSFDPANAQYDQYLTELVWDVKRVSP
ncbi:MAG: hypothetical protein E6J34_11970 [Chloroflexi bacterium]|nr:MAG: hypothetical protein E6J34_11970 [Chloroflexota bacterium]